MSSGYHPPGKFRNWQWLLFFRLLPSLPPKNTKIYPACNWLTIYTKHWRLNSRAPQQLAVHCAPLSALSVTRTAPLQLWYAACGATYKCRMSLPLSSQRHLRSTERNLLHVPRHRLNTYGRRRAFAIAGPSAWNSHRTLSAIRTPPKLLSGAC